MCAGWVKQHLWQVSPYLFCAPKIFWLLMSSRGPCGFPRPGGNAGESQSLSRGACMAFSQCPALKGCLSDHTIPALVGRDLKDPLIPTRAMARDTFHHPSLLHPVPDLPILTGNNPFPLSILNPQMNFCSTRTSHLIPPARRSPCTSETAAELSFPFLVCFLTCRRHIGSCWTSSGNVSPEYLPMGRA